MLPEWKHLTLSAPKMPLRYGVNHGKIFVLFLSENLVRVAVSTANLLSIDYHRVCVEFMYLGVIFEQRKHKESGIKIFH